MVLLGPCALSTRALAEALALLKAAAVYPWGQRSIRTTEVLSYPVSGRCSCLYVWGGMVGPSTAKILHSTDHTLVSDGKLSNPLYSTRLAGTLFIPPHSEEDSSPPSSVDSMASSQVFVSTAMLGLFVCFFFQYYSVLVSPHNFLHSPRMQLHTYCLCFLCGAKY